MKLSTLHEARDPKKEAELEPLITAPFKTYATRRKEGEELERLKPVPEPEFHTDDEFGGRSHEHPRTQNITRTGTPLLKAYGYWSTNFNSERWPAIEQAFLNRAWTFKGGRSAENSARTLLFKYLNNIKESWPEGEAMANQVLSSRNALYYYRQFAEVKKYVALHPVIPGFIKAINTAIAEVEARQKAWDFISNKHHDTYQPPRPKDFAEVYPELVDYASGKLPKPEPPKSKLPKQRKRHPSDYPEHLRQTPPFAGWA